MSLPLKYIAVAAALSTAGDVQAQRLHESRVAARSPTMRVSLGAPRGAAIAADSSPNVGLMILAGIGFGAAGTFGGGYLGAALEQRSCSQYDDFCGLAGAIVGAFIGEAFMLPLGVHIAGKRKGHYPLELLASLGISAVGTAIAAGTEQWWPFVVIPPLQLWVSVAEELRGAKRAR